MVTINGSSNGAVTLTASNGCGSSSTRTWNVYANSPLVSSSEVLVDGHPNYYPNYTTGSSYISVQGGGSCQTYKWELFGGSGYFSPGYCGSCNNNFNGISFTDCNASSASTSSSMAIRIKTANRCGQGNDIIIPLELSGGFFSMVSANPTPDNVIIKVNNERLDKLISIDIFSNLTNRKVKTYDALKNKLIGSSQNISFSLADQPRGLYYIILKFTNNLNFKELVLLN